MQTGNLEVENFDVLSRATYVSNPLYHSKRVSSCELSRGYTPSMAGSFLFDQIIAAREEQLACRAALMLDKGSLPKTLLPEDLRRGLIAYILQAQRQIWQMGNWK